MVIRDHQSGQKKFLIPEMKGMRKKCSSLRPPVKRHRVHQWNKRYLRPAINSFMCTQCLPVIRIPSLFHRVERTETDFKLLAVYTVICQKSREKEIANVIKISRW